MATIDLMKLRVAMQTLCDLTHFIDARTDYGEPIQAYRMGMKALVDYERYGGKDLIVRAARVAEALDKVHAAGVSCYRASERKVVQNAVVAFLLATVDETVRVEADEV